MNKINFWIKKYNFQTKMIRKEIEKKYEGIFFFQKGLDNIIQKKKKGMYFFLTFNFCPFIFNILKIIKLN